jgi:cyclopropane-fatty-acyl-phospholipid synthase
MQIQKIILLETKKIIPIKLKILNKNLHYKLLFHPDLYFGEAYTDGEIIIENGTLNRFFRFSFNEFWKR